MKNSLTKKKLQNIKTVAIENELMFKEKNLIHQLKKNSGQEYKMKKYLQSIGFDDTMQRRSNSSARMRTTTSVGLTIKN